MNGKQKAADALYDALAELVKANEDWNAAVLKIIQRPPGWSDKYLDKARAALKLADEE